MKLNHINKIKANITIYTDKKTTNILDGTYKSVYKGKSMNFENLRSYVINDDIKDIDWKSSTRSGELLVKQFVAEKKHNILIIIDSGNKMNADTSLNENKKDIALLTAGTIAYVAITNGDYAGICYSTNEKIIYKPFKNNLYHLEEYLCEYETTKTTEPNYDINAILKNILKSIKRKLIIFVISDLEGINNIETKTLKNIKTVHDLLLININDHLLFGENNYDIEEEKYIPNILSKDPKLKELEKELIENILKENKKKLQKNKICNVEIKSKNEINNKIIELLEEHKYANRN